MILFLAATVIVAIILIRILLIDCQITEETMLDLERRIDFHASQILQLKKRIKSKKIRDKA